MGFGLRRLWRRKPLLIAGFSIALALTIVFGLKTAMKYSQWARHEDKPVASWMTPRFVARSKHVDIEIVLEALGLPADEKERRTIFRIARDTGKLPSELVQAVDAAVIAARSEDRGN